MFISERSFEKIGFALLMVLVGVSGIYTRQWMSWILPGGTLLWLWQRQGVQGLSFRLSAPFVFLFLFIVWGGVSLSWALAPGAGLKAFGTTLITVGFGVLFLSLIGKASIDICLRISSLLKGAGFLLISLVLGQSSWETFSGSLYLIKHAGSMLSVSAFVGCGLLWIQKQRLTALATFVLLALIIALTRCQTALYALFCGAGVFMISYFFPRIITWGAIVGSFIVLIITPVFCCYSAQALKLQWVLDHKTFFHRVLGWNFLTQKVFEKPLLGWGMGSTPFLAEGREFLPGYPYLLHPHNYALQAFLELGLLGSLLFAGFVASLFWAVQRHLKDPLSIAVANATLVTFLVEGQISQNLWYNYWLSWEIMVAGFVLVFLKIRAEPQPVQGDRLKRAPARRTE